MHTSSLGKQLAQDLFAIFTIHCTHIIHNPKVILSPVEMTCSTFIHHVYMKFTYIRYKQMRIPVQKSIQKPRQILKRLWVRQ